MLKPMCVPLLKFNAGEEQPCLCDEGLRTLASLSPPISVVTFLGDGRSGKSTLASKLIDDEKVIFPVGDSGEPVTQGIDMYVRESKGGGSLVILDCEGENNPMATLRTTVDLVAMYACTLTVQVAWGQMSEKQLEQIGDVLATRDRNCRKFIDGVAIQSPTQRLLLVVNGCHLNYTQEDPQSIFQLVHTGSEASRNELRANIDNAYEQIHFCNVPIYDDPSYPNRLSEFKMIVDKHSAPVMCNGVQLSGLDIIHMFESVLRASQKAGSVPVQSVYRHIVFDNLLMPVVNELASSFENSMPDPHGSEYMTNLKDTRSETMHKFETKTQMLRCVELVEEARQKLATSINTTWERVSMKNFSVGEQICDMTTEYDVRWSHAEDRNTGRRKSCWCVGRQTPVIETVQVFRTWTRTRALKKNGAWEYSDWRPSTTMLEKSEPNALFSTGPVLDRHRNLLPQLTDTSAPAQDKNRTSEASSSTTKFPADPNRAEPKRGS